MPKRSVPLDISSYALFREEKVQKVSQLKTQGHCNVNYLIETEHSKYLLRKFKHKRDRKAEFQIQNLAHQKGIGAKALLLDEKEQLMICGFVEGKHREKLKQQELKKLARLLRKLHKIKIQQQPNTFKNAFKFKDKKAQEALRIIKTFQPEYVLGHNDLHSKNILFGRTIQFIDWEYAGKTDRYFDLASIIIEYKLNRRDEQMFLYNYFLREKRVNRKKLEAFKLLYKTLWTVWFEKLERGEIVGV